ncbi:MAG: AEC family transporter [bacterium]|nr:AEC family transporter [bacterium]
MVLPLIGMVTCFLVGLLLRSHPKHDPLAHGLMKGVIFVAFPSLIFPLAYQAPFQFDMGIYLLFVPMLLIVTAAVCFFLGRRLGLSAPLQGSLTISAMAMNTGLILPLVLVFFGEAAAGLLIILDVLFSISAFSVVWFLAHLYSDQKQFGFTGLKRAFLLPPVWAIVLGLGLRYSGLSVPNGVIDGLLVLGKVSILMLPVAIGLFFRLDRHDNTWLSAMVLTRILIGGLVGLFFVFQFKISAPYSHAILLCAIAPTGIKGVMISHMAGVDDNFVATSISLTTVVSMILTFMYGFLVA